MTYKTVLQATSATLKDRGSKFIAHIIPIGSEDEAKEHLSNLWKEHPKARHICYAFRLGGSGQQYRVNDDGEPSGSAGLPIYNQLLSHELTNILAAVIRYFGGTKLGVPGLIHAYKESTNSAIKSNAIIEKELKAQYEIVIPYKYQPFLLDYLSKEKFPVIHESYTKSATIRFSIPRKNENKILTRTIAHSLQVPENMVHIEDLPEGVSLTLIEREE